jgi:hypothetical protein
MPNEEMGHRRMPQPAGVSSGAVIASVAGFLGFVALSMTGLFFYLRSAAPGAFNATIERQFPAPELQKNPQRDLQDFERDQRATLSGYGWIDRSKGIARIPIEQAMQIVAARGAQAYDAPDQPAVAPASASTDGGRP